MNQDLRSQVLAGVRLHVRPAVAPDGASLTLTEEPVAEPGPLPFFGGHAEDLLADMGFDVAEEAPATARAKTV